MRKRAWKLLSELVRRSYANDQGLAQCYTCLRWAPWQEMDAGHGVSGRRNSVLFDERVIRPQDKRCNIFLHGNYEVFTARLMREHLWSPDDWLAIVAQAREPRKISYGEYEAMIESYLDRLRKLDHHQ